MEILNITFIDGGIVYSDPKDPIYLMHGFAPIPGYIATKKGDQVILLNSALVNSIEVKRD